MLNPALEFYMSACVTEMRGDYNFEKRCKGAQPWELIYAVITLDLIGSAKPGPRSRQRPCLSDIVVNDARHN